MHNKNNNGLGMLSQIKTERSWFMAFFGACFAVPALLIFTFSIFPAFYDAVKMQV